MRKSREKNLYANNFLYKILALCGFREGNIYAFIHAGKKLIKIAFSNIFYNIPNFYWDYS